MQRSRRKICEGRAADLRDKLCKTFVFYYILETFIKAVYAKVYYGTQDQAQL